MFGGQHREFDIFYNPSVRISSDILVAPREGVDAWRDLARRCLRFEPDKRLASLQIFAEELDHLIATFPLFGCIRVVGFHPKPHCWLRI